MTDNDETNERLLTRKDAARHMTNVLGYPMSHMTLDAYASKGYGPRYIKIGRRVFYRPSRLRHWIESRTSEELTSTSHEASLRRNQPSSRSPTNAG